MGVISWGLPVLKADQRNGMKSAVFPIERIRQGDTSKTY
jgi:hypothetical protein